MKSSGQTPRNAWNQWIGRHPYHHRVTLTTMHPMGEQRLQTEFEAFIRRVNSANRLGVWWVVVHEIGEVGRRHLHALIGGTDQLSSKIIQRQWPLGLTDVKRIDNPEAAIDYITKDLPKGEAAFYASENTDRLLQRWIRRRDEERAAFLPEIERLRVPAQQIAGKDVDRLLSLIAGQGAVREDEYGRWLSDLDCRIAELQDLRLALAD